MLNAWRSPPRCECRGLGGVSIAPGAATFTRIPCGARSAMLVRTMRSNRGPSVSPVLVRPGMPALTRTMSRSPNNARPTPLLPPVISAFPNLQVSHCECLSAPGRSRGVAHRSRMRVPRPAGRETQHSPAVTPCSPPASTAFAPPRPSGAGPRADLDFRNFPAVPASASNSDFSGVRLATPSPRDQARQPRPAPPDRAGARRPSRAAARHGAPAAAAQNQPPRTSRPAPAVPSALRPSAAAPTHSAPAPPTRG